MAKGDSVPSVEVRSPLPGATLCGTTLLSPRMSRMRAVRRFTPTSRAGSISGCGFCKRTSTTEGQARYQRVEQPLMGKQIERVKTLIQTAEDDSCFALKLPTSPCAENGDLFCLVLSLLILRL